MIQQNREDQPVAVSVLCTAFNQERYIEKCLEGFVMQQTDFFFEVIVNDDASTDATAQIIREYAQKYPDIIKPVYQRENQFSKGVRMLPDIMYPLARGKYVAICEGDDYWTDPHKLQTQYDALESHPQIDMCAHCAQVATETGEWTGALLGPGQQDRLLSTEDVILGDGGYLATNSLFFRSTLCREVPEYVSCCGLDYAIQIYGASRGGVLYLGKTMSAYRSFAEGSYSTTIFVDTQKMLRVRRLLLKMLTLADAYTGGAHREAFSVMQKQYRWEICLLCNDCKSMLRPEYREYFRKLPPARRIKKRLQAYFPFLKKLKHGAKHSMEA